ncbi:MAG: PAS domain S-box protein, partial [Candidatus Marinimicrobia bacterium]|nr:PAS domain S-box protein [Candidatus Neomarinimicrobiota bacterium]
MNFKFFLVCICTTFLSLSHLYGQHDEQSLNHTSYPVLHSASEYDYPPFAIVTPDGQADGFAVELLARTLEVMHRSVEFKVGPWHEISDDLRYGRIDVLPFVGRTPAREEYFDFTIPYITIHGTVVTRTQNTEIQSVNDLQDKKVLVMEDDTAHEYVLRAGVSDSLVLTESYEEALKALSQGQYDAVVMQAIVALDLINRLGITNLKTVGGPIEEFSQEFCFAVQEGDRQLLSLLNEGLAILIENGTLHELQTEWFTEEIAEDKLPLIARSLLFTLLIIIAGLLLMELAHRRENQRQRAEVQRAKAQLASIVEKSNDAIFSHDPDGFIMTWNSGATDMYGYTLEEIIGKPFTKLFSEKDSTVADLYLNQIKNDHVIQEHEVTHVTKSGQELFVSLSISPMRNETGNIIGASIIAHDITARKKAEEALRKSENRFRRIFDEAPYGAAIVSLNYEYVLVNRALVEVTGYSPSELVGKKFTEITHPEDLDEDLSFTEQLLAGEIEQYDNEKRYICKDGSIVRVHISVRLMKDSDGSPLYFLPMIEDITEKKEAEKKIRESRSNLRAMIENTQDGIWAVDMDYNITVVNSVYKRLFKAYFGKDLNEGDYILDIVPDVNIKDWTEVVERAKKGEFWITSRTYTVQGRQMHFEISHNPIKNNQGEVVGLSMQSQDITERKKAERALRESERDFRNIIEHMQEGFYRIAMDGTILMVNPWLTKILECDSETDLVNKNVNDLEYGMAEDREEFIQKLLSEESIQHYQ